MSLDQLVEMSPPQLRAYWRDVMKDSAPDISPNLLRLALAYRLQERRDGKLSPSHQRHIVRLQKQLLEKGSILPAGAIKLLPGTQLIRRWSGQTHVVLVHDDGFEYRNERYKSLTPIAKHITGAHWSGPRFFGLTSSVKQAKRNA